MEVNSFKALNESENCGIFKTEDLIKMGFSKPTIAKYCNKGYLKKVSHGIYITPNAIEDNLYIMTLISNKIIVSHENALYLNGLSERTPFSYTVTMSDGSKLPSSLKDNTKCFYVSKKNINLGLEKRKTIFGNEVPCYNAERTICDLVRSRNKSDNETLIMAIKNYAAYQNKDLNRLYKYAKTFKVYKIIKQYLEVLLWTQKRCNSNKESEI